jgi:very-short-patch-repair endonuclease
VNVNAIFAGQDNIITRKQAFDAGMSRSSISRRVTSGEWTREAPCVYRRSNSELTPHAALRVAVLSAGEDAVAFGPSAAWWHGLGERPEFNWVSIPLHRALGFQLGRRIKRQELRAEDVATIQNLRVTSLPLTVLETAALLPYGQSFLDRSLQHDRVSMASLIDCHRRNSRRPGAATMARMLAESAEGARSAGERRLVAILRQSGIDGWVTHVRALGYLLDIAFIRHGIAIEVDGWAHEARLLNAERKRRHTLANGGWTVLRYTWQELTETPERVVAEIRAALELAHAC